MFLFFSRRVLLSAAAACVVLLGVVGSAQASNRGLRSTIRASNPKLNRDEVAVAKGLQTYAMKHDATPAVTALRHEVRDIHSLDGKLKTESASSAKGRRAKADITKALSLIARSYSKLATDLQHSSSGAPVSKASVTATLGSDKKGRKLLVTGLKLLG